MNILNLTPHPIHIVDDAHNVVHTFAPSGCLARVEVQESAVTWGVAENGAFTKAPFKVVRREIGELNGFDPAFPDGVPDAVIVSAQVADAVKNALNAFWACPPAVFTVGPVIRNADGSPIGVKHLVLN